MHSIKSKITLITVIPIIATMIVATLIAGIAINKVGNDSAYRILELLCETGEKDLDLYFTSVEQSAKTIAKYAEDDLKKTSISDIHSHLEKVKDVFENTAEHTSGVLTFYYRIDPAVDTDEKGFWFVRKTNDQHFYEHEVTDITLYDTEDQSSLVWFTVPKHEGRSIWLPPYVTENLDVYVLSYNVPIYKDKTFIGVIGIEIDYNTIVQKVNNITLYKNGYAFINDSEGNIIYHPHFTVAELRENHPKVPEGLLAKDKRITYVFENVEKEAVWLKLENDMRLNVTVPVAEINANWQTLMSMIILVSILLLVIFVLIAISFSDRITKPLKKLSEAAEQVNNGNYNIDLSYNGDDEVGVLTNTFTHLVENLKVYINDLNSIAYRDALTSVHNKSAYDIYAQELQNRITNGDDTLQFAIVVFDCDNLKRINDQYGHDKGDIYLKTACKLICTVFKNSPVFRTGGDEFTAILQNEDFFNLQYNISEFRKKNDEIVSTAKNDWEAVSVAIGVAKYDFESDRFVSDIARRADKLMYEDKRARKVVSE